MKTLFTFWPEWYFLTLIGMTLIPWPGWSAWSMLLLSLAAVFLLQTRFRNTLTGGLLVFGLAFCLLLLDTQIMNALVSKQTWDVAPLYLGIFAILINLLTIAALRKMAIRYRVVNW
ncbi:hypothetical protein [Rurimicrobium arvi]|uniref:Uncharacterized protein n=1 Tax=Rurimicrobium arvi TaxID=2049916 RepID=A0ABP8MLP8_9BACT